MLYDSTRGGERGKTASQAILEGLAADGGLYVPREFPHLDVSPEELAEMDYRETAYHVMKLFLTDFSEEELRYCIDHAYDEKFDTPAVCPLHKAESAGVWFLELFHGKTIAFKDMALSILPYLLTVSAKKNHVEEEIVILTATSGDTGKAALAGFADVPGTSIIVFYPKEGVSPVQERQMITQKGENTHVIGIRGNFDDAQTGVKKIFSDKDLRKELLEAGCLFSSANSINIGRLVPQIAYYVYAYTRLIGEGVIKSGDPVNFTVPTGNFGNILAAYFAMKIGIPVRKLICASNKNNVLFDFFRTGTYDKNRTFYVTSSPSMDILVSSNLERLLYLADGRNAEETSERMKELTEKGIYSISEDMKKEMSAFVGSYSTEEEVMETIHDLYEKDRYVIDPHTAVGAHACRKYTEETNDHTPAVIASTASPYKFGRSVLHAVGNGIYDEQDDTEQFYTLEKVSSVPIPGAIQELLHAEVRHRTVTDPDKMKDAVRSWILGRRKRS
ncbi:MAG: threonine synthase [Eubacterium sp.]|nr:threonine synthase [Eubacterium sp.]